MLSSALTVYIRITLLFVCAKKDVITLCSILTIKGRQTKWLVTDRNAPSIGRAGGQCPPYVNISFLGFDFRNKTVVQDLR